MREKGAKSKSGVVRKRTVKKQQYNNKDCGIDQQGKMAVVGGRERGKEGVCDVKSLLSSTHTHTQKHSTPRPFGLMINFNLL